MQLTEMTGIDQMRAVQSGAATRPGIAMLLGMTIELVEPGHVQFSLTTRPDMSNPMGSVHGGIPATLLDSVMGCAVHTTLAVGEAYTTTDLHVHYTRGIRLDEGLIVATGDVVHRGRRIATAEGRLHNADGKMLAHATTTCLMMSAG